MKNSVKLSKKVENLVNDFKATMEGQRAANKASYLKFCDNGLKLSKLTDIEKQSFQKTLSEQSGVPYSTIKDNCNKAIRVAKSGVDYKQFNGFSAVLKVVKVVDNKEGRILKSGKNKGTLKIDTKAVKSNKEARKTASEKNKSTVEKIQATAEFKALLAKFDHKQVAMAFARHQA